MLVHQRNKAVHMLFTCRLATANDNVTITTIFTNDRPSNKQWTVQTDLCSKNWLQCCRKLDDLRLQTWSFFLAGVEFIADLGQLGSSRLQCRHILSKKLQSFMFKSFDMSTSKVRLTEFCWNTDTNGLPDDTDNTYKSQYSLIDNNNNNNPLYYG